MALLLILLALFGFVFAEFGSGSSHSSSPQRFRPERSARPEVGDTEPCDRSRARDREVLGFVHRPREDQGSFGADDPPLPLQPGPSVAGCRFGPAPFVVLS
jgi:hypothetical protein